MGISSSNRSLGDFSKMKGECHIKVPLYDKGMKVVPCVFDELTWSLISPHHVFLCISKNIMDV